MIARLAGGFTHEVAERGRNLSAGQRQLIAPGPRLPGRSRHPAARRGDRRARPGHRGGRAPAAAERPRRRAPRWWSPTGSPPAARADRIVVIADGRITETGTHDELLAAGGSYASLWAAFTGGRHAGRLSRRHPTGPPGPGPSPGEAPAARPRLSDACLRALD